MSHEVQGKASVSMYLCDKHCFQLCSAGGSFVLANVLTSAVNIVTIAGHHELLQVGVGAGGGHHGVTPGLATHAAPRVAGELHQLNIIIRSISSVI